MKNMYRTTSILLMIAIFGLASACQTNSKKNSKKKNHIHHRWDRR